MNFLGGIRAVGALLAAGGGAVAAIAWQTHSAANFCAGLLFLVVPGISLAMAMSGD